MRTQQSMFAFFLLAGGAVVRMAAPGALIGYGMLEKRASLGRRRKVRMGGRGLGGHGESSKKGE